MEKAVPEMVFQVGMIVRSVDETLEKLKACFAIDESSIVVKTTKDMAEQGIFTDNLYLGKPTTFYIKTARLNFGCVDFEYVEPLNQGGGDPFSDWLLEHGQGIHHVNMKFKDRDQAFRNFEELGIPELHSAKMRDKSYSFYDLREQFGFIAEVGEMVVGPMAEQYYANQEN